MLLCVVISGMLVEQSNGFKLFRHGFKKCMKKCLFLCVLPPWTPACPGLCFGKCIINPAAIGPQSTHQFCTAGCATSECSGLISADNYHLDEVEGCVGGCSQSCVTGSN
ncbi:thionin-like protein 2 [Mercurialis annua]|uniref:thionin-like protein 2 n=1 Tax=Mercurialis annua TaxID=3986 RepID=UPI00215E1105|nr:thionin-like protein 2 [Mercurialis annua]XP_050232924.2 thionin-like protein 2 [Mercurialis annua]